MERVVERGCGLDVHKKTVAACVRVPGARGGRAQHVRTFGTTTPELLALGEYAGKVINHRILINEVAALLPLLVVGALRKTRPPAVGQQCQPRSSANIGRQEIR
jgi:hypothetical protein